MSQAKVLVMDIEISPLITYTWGIYDVNAIEVIEDWQILCFAYKWLDDKKTYVVSQDDFKGYKPGVNNDFMVVAKLWALFNEADVVIAHNGDKFDIKKVNARFMAHGLTPPAPYKTIDTLKVARKYASFTSNKLDDLGVKLGVGRKESTGGFETWKGCVAGDKKAWDKMRKYNKQDVVLLENVYYRLRPWIQNHPAINVINGDRFSCPKCGAGPLQKRGTNHITKTGRYQRYQCQSCGGWSQERTAEKVDVFVVN